MAEVGLDRLRADEELLRDLAVGESERDPLGDLALAAAEALDAIAAGGSLRTGRYDALAERAQLARRLVSQARGAADLEPGFGAAKEGDRRLVIAERGRRAAADDLGTRGVDPLAGRVEARASLLRQHEGALGPPGGELHVGPCQATLGDPARKGERLRRLLGSAPPRPRPPRADRGRALPW